ncbi:MAG: transposase [Pseudomonadota bacterium]
MDDADREEFLSVLGSVGERSGWRLYAYCLMDNHYHLMVETPKGKLRSPNPGQKRRAPIRDSKNSPCRTTNSELNRP